MAPNNRYLHSVYQVRRPDATQPFEDSLVQRCPVVPDILELLAISGISDVGEAPEEVVHIMAAQQITNRGHIAP